MGHFSVETYAPPGSHLSANQQYYLLYARAYGAKLKKLFYPSLPSLGARQTGPLTEADDGPPFMEEDDDPAVTAFIEGRPA